MAKAKKKIITSEEQEKILQVLGLAKIFKDKDGFFFKRMPTEDIRISDSYIGTLLMYHYRKLESQ